MDWPAIWVRVKFMGPITRYLLLSQLHMYVRMYVYIYMYPRIPIYVYIYIITCMRIYIYIHTYLYLYKSKLRHPKKKWMGKGCQRPVQTPILLKYLQHILSLKSMFLYQKYLNQWIK
jgi:hypothetical protein